MTIITRVWYPGINVTFIIIYVRVMHRTLWWFTHRHVFVAIPCPCLVDPRKRQICEEPQEEDLYWEALVEPGE